MFTIYATDYAPVDPITPPCDIVPIFIGYKGENKARCLVFDLTECVNTFGDGGFVISFIRQGDELPYLVTNTDRLDNNAIWIITDTDTAVDGYGMVQLQYIVDDVVCKSALYRTVTFDSNGITGDVPDPYEDLLAQIAAYAAQAEGAATTATAAAQTATTAVEEGVKTERSQRIAADEGLNTRINELMGLAGAPSMANSAAAMTDSSKIYVYTGNEAGYLTGHWYYYNGTEWADGGVYQATAISTDKTLTVENMAADAAVVGEKIDECMAAFVVNSASGSIASFTDGADGVPLKDLVVNISPVQSGTGDPSPTNVRAISGWTEANITMAGKNLLPMPITSGSYGGGTTITVNSDLSFYMTKTETSWVTFTLGTFTLPSGTYTVVESSDTSNTSTIELYNNVTSAKLAETKYSKVREFTLAEATQVRVTYARAATADSLLVKLMMFYGTGYTADDYEPYTANTYEVSFGSADTVYGGTLDVTTGMLTVTHAVRDMGTMSWQYETDGAHPVFRATISGRRFGTDSDGIVGTCSIYRFYRNSTSTSLKSNLPNLNFGFQTTNTWTVFRDDSYTNVADFTAAVTGQLVYFELAQPVSYQLTPTEIKTLLANNNIWSDTGSVASCDYRADTKLYLEKLTTPDDDMVANANITSGSYFMVGNSLYLATSNIANGGAITPGTNCTATNLAAALNAINS